MERPVGLKILPNDIGLFRVEIQPAALGRLIADKPEGPAVLLTSDLAILQDGSVGMIDCSDLTVLVEGDLSQALLLVSKKKKKAAVIPTIGRAGGDASFVEAVNRKAPELQQLAERMIVELRANGVGGALVEDKAGRWVNRPVNSFTLKAQPRAGNFAFTIYGEPSSYQAGDFLRKDQNSYSRGWIATANDLAKFIKIARESYDRRSM